MSHGSESKDPISYENLGEFPGLQFDYPLNDQMTAKAHSSSSNKSSLEFSRGFPLCFRSLSQARCKHSTKDLDNCNSFLTGLLTSCNPICQQLPSYSSWNISAMIQGSPWLPTASQSKLFVWQSRTSTLRHIAPTLSSLLKPSWSALFPGHSCFTSSPPLPVLPSIKV